MTRKRRVTTDPNRVNKVQTFLSDSLDDYIAARVLFLSKLPQQAAILSSTAIEKSFKAILAFHGNVCHGHLQAAHWRAVKNFDPNLYNMLDIDFLELNRKAYMLRYTDDLPSDYNLVVATREFLAELDHTLYLIHTIFKVDWDGKERKTKFGSLLSLQDSRLFSDNYVLMETGKDTFIYGKPQLIYEVRKPKNRDGLLEATYVSSAKPTEPGFMRSGCTEIDPFKFIYKFSHLPHQDPDVNG